VSRGVLHLISAYFVLFAPAARRASARYLARVHGRPARWREVYAHVYCFAATILDRVYFLRRETGWLQLTLHGQDMIDNILAEGQGAFLVGAHVGSFEALRASGQDRPDLRIAMVMYPDNARKINAALAAIAPDAVPDIIALGRPQAMLQIRERLAEGALVGMLGDRTLHAESNRGQPVRLPFLGDEVEFSDGPFRLAELLRQRIVFMVGLYLGGSRYEVRLEPLADFRERPVDAADREARIRAALADYVRRLESLCREQPCNWFNFHDFWRDDEAR
jgi:predicted LPLAT superfamily acyltransferase